MGSNNLLRIVLGFVKSKLKIVVFHYTKLSVKIIIENKAEVSLSDQLIVKDESTRQDFNYISRGGNNTIHPSNIYAEPNFIMLSFDTLHAILTSAVSFQNSV